MVNDGIKFGCEKAYLLSDSWFICHTFMIET